MICLEYCNVEWLLICCVDVFGLLYFCAGFGCVWF